jgi:hypothetical protein
VTKSKGWARYDAGMEETRNAYTILVAKSHGWTD